MSAGKDLRRDVGELFCTGFHGRGVDKDFERFFKTTHVGSVILFKENCTGPEQVWNLTAQLRRAAGAQVLIGIDQEGGKVQRLKEPPFTVLPPMRNVGTTGSTDVARRVGRVLGTELGALGINLDFAPVLDLDLHPDSVIGDRAFSADPRTAAALGLALADELWASGVAGCAKHFPGHGATGKDSHVGLPVAELSLAELRATHLVPFALAAKARVPMVMVAHVLFPAGDPTWPASLSPFWVDTVLRGELGYEGVVVTDELGMGAIATTHRLDDAVLQLLKTSVDLFMIRDRDACAAAVETVHRALAVGWVDPARVHASAERVRALKQALAGRQLLAERPEDLAALIGDAESKALADSLRF